MKKRIFLFLILVFSAMTVQADELMPSRSKKPFGIVYSIGSVPFPGGCGYNLAYNPTWFSRVYFGYSDNTDEKVFGGSLRVFPLKSKFSPMYALCVGNYRGPDNYNYYWEGFNKNETFVYSLLGVDLQAHSGFHVSFGAIRGHWEKGRNGIFVDLGWFFGFGKRKKTEPQPAVASEPEANP